MKRSQAYLVRGVLGVGLMVLLSAPRVDAATFQGLGDLSGGSDFSRAYEVNSDGSVVVGRGTSADGTEAFRWTSGGMGGLGDLSGGFFDSEARGVDADGTTVAGRGDSDSGTEAFRWKQSSSILFPNTREGLGDLPGGSFLSLGRAVSGDGSVIVGEGTSADGPEAFQWNSTDGMDGLGDLSGGSFYSVAHDVDADGSVIVGESNSSNGREAFRWTSSGMGALGDLSGGSFFSRAYGVDSDGSVIVGEGTSDDGTEAFRWTSSGMTGLGDLPGGAFFSIAQDVSGDGSIVVGQSESAAGNEAFVWHNASGMQGLKQVLEDAGLDLSGWSLTEATAISADGTTVVGYGDNPSGDTEAFRATLPDSISVPTSVPTPLASTGGLVLLGLIAATKRRIRGIVR